MKTFNTVMLSLILLVAGSNVLSTPVSESGHAAYYTTLDEGLKVATENDRPLLIKFFTDWCKWCKTLDTVVFVDPVAIKYFADEVVLVKINAEVDTLVAQKYRVSGYPTSVLLGTDGNEIDRIIGYEPTEEFLETLEDYRQGKGTLGAMLKQAAEKGTDRELFLEIADKYKYSGLPEDAEVWFDKVARAGEPLDSLSATARLAFANMFYRAKDYDKSMSLYEQVKNDFGPNMFGELADIYCAIIYRKTGDTTAAIEAFQQFAKDYPESEDFEYAQEWVEKLSAKKDAPTN